MPFSQNPRKPGLTARMRAFVREYCVLRNGAHAARAAGYKASASRDIGYRLLRRPEIQTAIREHEAAEESVVGSRKHSVLERLNEVANRAMERVPVGGEKTGKSKPGAPSRMSDGPTAVSALKLLGQHEGMFTDAIEVRVQGALENLLGAVRPLMPQQSYAHLLRAIAEIHGVDRVDPETAAGDRGDPVH